MNDKMTDKQNQQFEWAWRGCLIIALGICGWFARDSYNRLCEFDNRVEARVSHLEQEQNRTTGNRFTSMDWIAAKTIVDERDANLDKRVTRVEDAIPAIKQSLERIENRLENMQSKGQ